MLPFLAVLLRHGIKLGLSEFSFWLIEKMMITPGPPSFASSLFDSCPFFVTIWKRPPTISPGALGSGMFTLNI